MSNLTTTVAVAVLAYATAGLAPAFAEGVPTPCEVTGQASFPGGESFDMNFGTDGTTSLWDFTHSAPGFEFETVTAPGGEAYCFVNGFISAELFGVGIGTVNGVPGYTYQVLIQDNQPPSPDAVTLTASITHRPTVRNDGLVEFANVRNVVIPASIDVREGSSGNGWTRLFLDEITCNYRGAGSTYDFVRCNDPLDSGYGPGDELNILSARLRVQQSDKSFPTTVVEVDIGASGNGPNPDTYYLIVLDSAENEVYSFTGLVFDGDIAIDIQ